MSESPEKRVGHQSDADETQIEAQVKAQVEAQVEAPRRRPTSGAPHLGRRAALLLAALVTLALVCGLSLLARPAGGVGTDVATSSVRSLVCPSIGSGSSVLAGVAAGDAHLAPLGASTSTSVSGLVRRDAGTTSWILDPSGPDQPVGGVLGEASKQWAACGTATASSLILLDDAATHDLLLVNPDAAAVAVNLTFTGPKGPRSVAGARGIVVQPKSSRVVPMEVLAGSGFAGVQVATDSGRVLAVARPVTTDTPGVVAAQTAASDLVLPAVAAKSTRTTMYLSNPGTVAATVDVAGLTASGRLPLAGAQQVSVPASSTIELDLTQAVAGEAMALAISSDHPIGASAAVTTPGGPRWVEPAATAAQLVGLVPGNDTLVIANPGGDSATVQVQVTTAGSTASTSRVISGGAIMSVELTKDAVVRLSSARAVAAALSLSGTGVQVPFTGAAVTGSVALQNDPGLH